MYQEKNKNTNSWIQIMLRSILVLLILILSIKLASVIVSNRTQEKKENFMSENLQDMMDVAEEYFEENNKPAEVGESIKITLKELIDEDLINKIEDEEGNACNNQESFIKITRLDKEYQYKAYLVCGKETDYLNEFKNIADSNEEDKSTTTTTTTKKPSKTTKKTTTTKTTTTKKTTTTTTTKIDGYRISFNSNGGTSVATQIVKADGKVMEVIPYREGYTFVGWYYHGSEFNFNTKINKNYVLVAKWTKK